jgi:hypothetical protein
VLAFALLFRAQLRILAIERDTTLQALAVEALNDLLAKYGKRPNVKNPHVSAVTGPRPSAKWLHRQRRERIGIEAASHVRAFSYFGGTARQTVSDNLK